MKVSPNTLLQPTNANEIKDMLNQFSQQIDKDLESLKPLIGSSGQIDFEKFSDRNNRDNKNNDDSNTEVIYASGDWHNLTP